MDAVSRLTGLTEEQILGERKSREIVDARWMAVKLMREAGYYPSQIAPFFGMGTRNVQIILMLFDDRVRYASDSMLRNNYEEAAKRLRSN